MAVLCAIGAPALAEEKMVTLGGKLVCALCTLKGKDSAVCQNVLRAQDPKCEAKNYHVEQKDAGKEFGHVCLAIPAVRATGTIVEKDGNTWFEPTKIDKMGKS